MDTLRAIVSEWRMHVRRATQAEIMAKPHPAAGLHPSWELAQIRHYVQRHADCTTPALREHLLAHGYDPQLVDQALAGGARAPSRLVPFLLGFGMVLVINALIYAAGVGYWLWALVAEGLAVGMFFTAGPDPMVATRWSWSARAEDLSDAAQGQRRQEREVVHVVGYGVAAAALASVVLSLLR